MGAAGNENSDACNKAPAYVPSAITVASSSMVSAMDSPSGFSNYGTCVDIWAPGSSIKSAGSSSDTQEATKSGTSMACPHVAGAAALLLSQSPTLTPAQVATTLVQNAGSDLISNIESGSLP